MSENSWSVLDPSKTVGTCIQTARLTVFAQMGLKSLKANLERILGKVCFTERRFLVSSKSLIESGRQGTPNLKNLVTFALETFKLIYGAHISLHLV